MKLVEVSVEAKITVAPKKLIVKFRVGEKWYSRTVFDWWGNKTPFVWFRGEKLFIDPGDVIGL